MVYANAPPHMGGVETLVDEVSTRLSAGGVEMTVLATDRSGELPREESYHGYRIRRWPAYPRSRDYYLAPGLARHLLTGNYDIFHVPGVNSLVPPAALAAARRARIPSVQTFNTGGHTSALRNKLRPLQWRLLRPLLRSAAALVAVSEYERQVFARILGVPVTTIRLIPNGGDRLPIDPLADTPQGSPLLVSVGRLERYKGHHRILRALPTVLERAPNARLVLAGSGPYEEPLRAMANQLGVGDRVTICGFGPERRAAMGKLVSDADVMCLLSEYEAQGIAVYEALATGTKALVADTTALSELGHAGLATTIPLEAPPEHVAAAALAVAAAPRTTPPALFSWDDCARELHLLYEEIASKHLIRHDRT
jgi:glycosyltransferase involved in cell wall biosynthesis